MGLWVDGLMARGLMGEDLKAEDLQHRLFGPPSQRRPIAARLAP